MSKFALLYLDLIKARLTQVQRLRPVDFPRGVTRGVTPGGFHEDERDHSQWYVKMHANPEHAYVEHLANQTYRALGHNAPHSLVLPHPATGHPVYLSKIIPGFKTLNQHMQEHGLSTVRDNLWAPHDDRVARKFAQGLAADTLVGNSDMHGDNAGVVHGRAPARIDNGSAFHLTAHGMTLHERPWAIPNLRRMSDSALHYHAAEYIGAEDSHFYHNAAALRPQVKAITELRDQHGGWRGFIEHHIPEADLNTKDSIERTMEYRTHRLEQHVNGQRRYADMDEGHEVHGISRHPVL